LPVSDGAGWIGFNGIADVVVTFGRATLNAHQIDKMVEIMRKHELLILVGLGFINISYAGSQITESDCEFLYTPADTFWYFTPASDPSTVVGAQCSLCNYNDMDCPVGRHHRCCLTIAGASKTSDTDYFGGVSTFTKGWRLYKHYSTKAELFRDVNKGELRKGYEKCMSE
ncbi:MULTISPECIES: hypothetical protein, partial [unclassified Endozoicomonas]